MMDIGFNLIEKSHPEIFEEKIGIIEFLRRIMKGEKLSYNLAVIGLDTLLYYAEDEEGISRHVRNILQDHANSFVAGNYIIQIIIEGNLYVVESSERPRVKYREEELLLYPIFGRVKQVDVKHFFRSP